MSEVDDFSRSLLEEAKRFYEKSMSDSANEGKVAYLHAALNVAFCALEAHINGIAEDFSSRPELSVLEKSLLTEKEIRFVKGEFVLTETLKMSRLEDRIDFLYRKFAGTELDKTVAWWPKLKLGLGARNELTHPKGVPVITPEVVKTAIEAILETLDVLFQAVYGRPYPGKGRGLDSVLNF